MAVLITAIVFRLLITAIDFALLTMVVVFLLWFLWRRLPITNYGDRLLALAFDFPLHAEQGRAEEERRNLSSVFWFARFISWSLFLLSFVLQQLRECLSSIIRRDGVGTGRVVCAVDYVLRTYCFHSGNQR